MHEPLYRPVLRDAFQTVWRGAKLWPLALGAGILLSGSVYDVVWRMLNALAPQASLGSFVGAFWAQASVTWPRLSAGELVFGGIKVFQITILFLIIAVAIAGISVICQGALVYILGTRKPGMKVKIKPALTVGARAFWPVLVLNILATAVLLATRSLLGVALAMTGNAVTGATYALYLLAFMTFTLVAIVAVIIQIFALNAMILQGATLAQALERGAILLKKHWVIVFEVALLLLAVGMGSWILALLANMILAAPFFVVMLTAATLGSPVLLYALLWLAIGVFMILMLAISGAVVLFQYAAWTYLFRRMGEGGALPKLHRWVRAWTHGYHVPGA